MAGFKVTKSYRSLKDSIEFSNPAIMREIGQRLVVNIVRRTMSGKDENNRNFAPYAASTRRRKPTYGGRGGVDLYETGQMLNNLDVTEVTAKTVKAGFTDSEMEARARHHIEGHGSLPVRAFMGISKSWVDDIIKLIKQRMKV